MASGSVPVLPGRVLLVDGDGLAYYCAGKDGSSVGDARRALNDKVESAARLVSAERVVILLTGSGSHKAIKDEHPLLKFYYTFPYALFFICLFNELCLVMMFLNAPGIYHQVVAAT